MKLKTLLVFALIILTSIITKHNAQSLTWIGTLGGNTSNSNDVFNDGKTVV